MSISLVSAVVWSGWTLLPVSFHISVTPVRFLAITLLLRIFQRFLVGFRSRCQTGHFIISMLSVFCSVTDGTVLHEHCSWLGDVCREGITCCWRRFWRTSAVILPCSFVQGPTPAAVNICKTMLPLPNLTSLPTLGSVFPQFDAKHNGTHLT